MVTAQDNRQPAVFPQGMCVFEQNMGESWIGDEEDNDDDEYDKHDGGGDDNDD